MKTSVIEKVLLFVIPITLMLENTLPRIGGVSVSFAVFGVALAYIVVMRHNQIVAMLTSRLFLLLLGLLVLFTVSEFLHLGSDLKQIFRIANMMAGALVIATLCRDDGALKVLIASQVMVGIILAAVILAAVAGVGLAAAAVQGSSGFRSQLMEDAPIYGDLNTISQMTGLGAVLTVVWASQMRNRWMAWALYGIALVCVLGSLFTLSRGGLVALVIVGALVAIFGARGARGRVKSIALVSLVALILAFALPSVVFDRVTNTVIGDPARRADGRELVYTAVVDTFPDYSLAGVGAGQFWGEWGATNGFQLGVGRGVSGAHNSLFQVWIYWGVLSALAFGFVLLVLLKIGFSQKSPVQKINATAIAFVMYLMAHLMFTHNIPHKFVSVGIGMLAAYALWLTPKAIAPKTTAPLRDAPRTVALMP